MEPAVKVILEQGLVGALLVVLGGLAFYLYRENTRLYGELQKVYKESQEERMQLYERRLQEAKDLLAVVERTNIMGESLKSSIEARTVALNELIKGFAALVQSTELSRERFGAQAARMEKALDDLLRRG